MLNTSKMLSAFLATILVACGGSVDGSRETGGTAGTGGTGGGTGGSGSTAGAAGTSGGAGTGGSAGFISDAISGSWNVKFDNATVTSEQPFGDPGSPPASIGQTVRLDLRKANIGYEAVFTTSSGEQTHYVGDALPDRVALSGSGVLAGGVSCSSRSETWKTIYLGLGANGVPDGTMTAQGESTIIQGDIAYSGTATGTGSASHDNVAPSATISTSSITGLGDSVFPWEPITVELSEGVDAAALPAALSTTGAVKVNWTVAPGDPQTSWAGVTRVSGRLDSFLESNASLQLNIAAGLEDLAHNKSLPTGSEVTVLGLGAVATGFDLDSDTAPLPVTWGQMKVAFAGQLVGSDPLCESGGCVLIGPSEAAHGPAAGIAGRLNAKNAKQLAIRYRLMAADSPYGTPGTPPLYYGYAFTATVATPDAEPEQSWVHAPQEFHALGGSTGEMHWATVWATHVVPVPPGNTSEVGFTIAFQPSNGGDCMGSPPFVGTLVIDSIVLQ
ncbi:MAG TPA: hypothetical protein PLI95_07755 [Polyangiaceae bacterium]|nr:hypothetical protein [Polyangiaceae bacterium]